MANSPDFVVTLSFGKNNEYQVTTAFTIALAALGKGRNTALVLMADGAHVGRKGYVDDIDVGEPFRPVGEMIRDFLQEGGKILACGG